MDFSNKNLAPRVSAAKKKWLLHAKVEKTWPLYLISWPLHLMLTNTTKMNYKWRCSRAHMWQAPTFFSGRGSAKTGRSAAVLVQVDCDTMPRRVKKNHGLKGRVVCDHNHRPMFTLKRKSFVLAPKVGREESKRKLLVHISFPRPG